MVVFLALLLIVGVTCAAGALILRYLQDERMLLSLHLVLLEVTVPKDLPEREKDREGTIQEQIQHGVQFLASLAGLREDRFFRQLLFGRPTWAFEIVAHPNGEIIFFVAVPRRYEEFMEKQILAYYPRADVRRVSDYTLFEAGDTVRGGVVRLTKKMYLPLKTYEDLPADSMQGITQALSKMEKGDAAAVQFVIRPSSGRWRRKGRSVARRVASGKEQSVMHPRPLWQRVGGEVARGAGESLRRRERDRSSTGRHREDRWLPQMSPAEQERLERVDKKASEYQFDVTMRLVVSCRSAVSADARYMALRESLTQFGDPTLNELRAKKQTKRKFFRDFIFRTFDPSKNSVLSLSELLSLFHFPLPSTETPNIRWRRARRAAAPANLPKQGVLLGYNDYRNVQTPVVLERDDRRRHLYMIGQTGTGKSTLFKHLILQDIHNGDGVGLVDPHGDLIEDILPHIPKERAADVILFDPNDTVRPLGLNMLETNDPNQRDLVVQELVLIIEKLAARLNPESIGPMFEHYLRNALLTLVEDPEATLIDIPRLFTDVTFRKFVVSEVKNPIVRQFWEKEYAQSLKGQQSADMLSYVISKLGRFISNDVIRNIIGQPTNSFDVRDVMDHRKILLVNLSKGTLGEINSDLLGFVLVSKLQIAALSRTDIPQEERQDFYLYLDEFQNFTTDTVATILSEARKYRLNLNLTNQFVGQLTDPIRDAVFGNVGTIVSYRIGVEDAELMAKQFAPVFDEYDLLNLEKFSAYVRLLVRNEPQRPFSLAVPPPPSGGSKKQAELIRELSRRTYGRARQDVEARIWTRLSAGGRSVPSSESTHPTTEPKPLGNATGAPT